MGQFRVTSRVVEWATDKVSKMDLSVLQMVTDIHREASIMAPKDSRALVNSGRIKREGSGRYSVIFGGGAVPYALRRHFENKKTPGSLHYLERPGDSISSNIRRYFRGL